MKYRTKLYLTFSGLILGAVFLVEGLSYFETRLRFTEMLRGLGLGIASTAAKLLDLSQVEAVKEDLNDKTPAFASLVNTLREVRDANRSKKIYVQYVYLIAPDPKNPNQIMILADSTEGAHYVPPGTAYPEGISIGIFDHLNEPFAPKDLITNQWGKFLPSYAPLSAPSPSKAKRTRLKSTPSNFDPSKIY